MTQGDNSYDFKPEESPPPPPKPGEPGWIPPVPIIEKPDPLPEEPADPDIEQHKGMALLGYICFLIPLLTAPNSKFAKFHANQGLLLFIFLMISLVVVALLEGAVWASSYFLSERITILNSFFFCSFHLLQVVLLVAWGALLVFGIIQAANGTRTPLPGIGHWNLIKQ